MAVFINANYTPCKAIRSKQINNIYRLKQSPSTSALLADTTMH